MQMKIPLTPELEESATRRTESGGCPSASEVRKKIQVSLDQLDQGEGIPGVQAYAQMKRRSAKFR
jgi:hypothetical protein